MGRSEQHMKELVRNFTPMNIKAVRNKYSASAVEELEKIEDYLNMKFIDNLEMFCHAKHDSVKVGDLASQFIKSKITSITGLIPKEWYNKLFSNVCRFIEVNYVGGKTDVKEKVVEDEYGNGIIVKDDVLEISSVTRWWDKINPNVECFGLKEVSGNTVIYVFDDGDIYIPQKDFIDITMINLNQLYLTTKGERAKFSLMLESNVGRIPKTLIFWSLTGIKERLKSYNGEVGKVSLANKIVAEMEQIKEKILQNPKFKLKIKGATRYWKQSNGIDETEIYYYGFKEFGGKKIRYLFDQDEILVSPKDVSEATKINLTQYQLENERYYRVWFFKGRRNHINKMKFWRMSEFDKVIKEINCNKDKKDYLKLIKDTFEDIESNIKGEIEEETMTNPTPNHTDLESIKVEVPEVKLENTTGGLLGLLMKKIEEDVKQSILNDMEDIIANRIKEKLDKMIKGC